MNTTVLVIFNALMFFLLILFVFVIPAIQLKRKGIKSYHFSSHDNAHNFNGKLIKLIFVLIALPMILFFIHPLSLNFFKPFKIEAFVPIGILLTIMGFFWTLFAQKSMSDSWRVGIDENSSNELKKNDAFLLSRNPVYLGMMVMLLGHFIVLNSLFHLMLLFFSWAVLSLQIRLEEEFLLKKHGDEYRAYCLEVRRWI
ncbi:MAG: isoprenylcysteine carboxylmethyltransferase family protein [Bacteriovoracaceae bacterium]|jgi:protein-S-isoprenylcysteine O-methyltransferase Ste14|nr:isoprenylcysteine carboxylmethyltransferase family protein [Bacteriovoracaceae bacterium]